MSEPKVDVYVQPGGEKYLQWARGKLDWLRALRLDLRLPALAKHWVIGDSRVSVSSADWVDRIRITAGGLRYLYIADAVFYDFGGSIVTDTNPPGGYSWYANPAPPPDYAPYVTGTQPPGWTGVGAVTTQLFVNYWPGSLTIATNGPTQGNNIADPTWHAEYDATYPTFDNTTQDPIDVSAQGAAKIDVGPLDAGTILAWIQGGHPTFTKTPPYTNFFADGELITVARLEYAYTGDLAEARYDAFQSSFGSYSVTKVRIAALTQYVYALGTDSWALSKTIDIPPGSLAEFSTTTYWGNVAFLSQKPISGVVDDSANKQFDTIYKAQMDTLKPLDPAAPPLTQNKLFKAISDLVT